MRKTKFKKQKDEIVNILLSVFNEKNFNRYTVEELCTIDPKLKSNLELQKDVVPDPEVIIHHALDSFNEIKLNYGKLIFNLKLIRKSKDITFFITRIKVCPRKRFSSPIEQLSFLEQSIVDLSYIKDIENALNKVFVWKLSK